LYSSPNRLVLLALHRSQLDFTDRQVEQLGAVRRPLSAALTFRAELSRAAAGLQPPSASYVPTQRENEVLALMARGWGDARIGHHLGITECTVRKHLGHVYERAGVSGRAAAAAWWAGVPQC
jgi:DNA-binding NarL/FixJ family response regulator